VGEVPRSGILVGAPHTSNWDWVATLGLLWSAGVRPRVLMKKELFRGPVGWFLRATGGIPVDRAHPGRLVEELATAARGDESFVIVFAAEGTRSRGRYWKSGFYRLAQQTGMPVSLGFIDGPSRTLGFGPTLQDADKRGIRPENRTEPRLREEERETPRDDAPAADPFPDSGRRGA